MPKRKQPQETFIEFMYSVDTRTRMEVREGDLTQDYYYKYCLKPFVSHEDTHGNDKITGFTLEPVVEETYDPLAQAIDIFIPEQRLKNQAPSISNSRLDNWLLANMYYHTTDTHKVQKEVLGKIRLTTPQNVPQLLFETQVKIPRITEYGSSEQTIFTSLSRPKIHWNRLREAILGQPAKKSEYALAKCQELLKDPRMRVLQPYTDFDGQNAKRAIENYPADFRRYFE
jgi:hypothetical protein